MSAMNMTRSRAKLRDIAQHAGVSVSTVSRALNNNPNIAPSTRQQVQRISAELGYRAMRASDGPRRVGLAVTLAPVKHVFDIIFGVGTALRDRNGRFELSALGEKPLAGYGVASLERFLCSGLDGAILANCRMTSAELAPILDSLCPFVIVDPLMALDERIPQVDAANFAGSRAATEHLIQLGHTRIGIVIGPKGIQPAADRLAGYHAALAAAGIAILPELQPLVHWPSSDRFVFQGELPCELGTIPALELLRLPQPPTAILAFNDDVALSVMRAARDCGLDVPRDLSVVGFDDAPMATIVTPALTTVRQPVADLGRTAVDMLYRLMDGENLGVRHMTLATKLVIRDSTGPVPTEARS